MGDVFTRRLGELDAKAKEALGAALKSTPEPAVVRSAFDLPAEERAKIQNAINETFSADIHLRFETAPDRISGIELTANGQKVAWSIADYLTSLQKGVAELLQQQDKPKPKSTPKADAKPEPKPEAAHKSEADGKPQSKPATKVEPDAKPATPKAVPEVIPEPANPTTAAAPKPDAKAEPSTKVKADPPTAAKPDTEAAEVAPVAP